MFSWPRTNSRDLTLFYTFRGVANWTVGPRRSGGAELWSYAFPQLRNSATADFHSTTSDGLSQSLVFAMVEGDQGFLWLGTQSGLNRYDGHKFKIFNPSR